jgi:hypothetical protein
MTAPRKGTKQCRNIRSRPAIWPRVAKNSLKLPPGEASSRAKETQVTITDSQALQQYFKEEIIY